MNSFPKPPKWLLYVGLVLLIYSVVSFLTPPGPDPRLEVANYTHTKRVDYSQVINTIRNEAASVEKLVFVKGLRPFPDKVIVDYKGEKSDQVADIPGEYDYNSLSSEADKVGVAKQSLPMSGKDAQQEYVMGPSEGSSHSPFTSFISIALNIAFIAIPIALLYMMWKGMKNMQNGGAAGAFAKSKHKKFEPEKGPTVKFSDVAGTDEAKEDVKYIVEFLKDPTEVKGLGGKIAKCVLLIGPPGTGKTLLAKAVAGEAGVPAFYINAAEFVEMYVGVGAARVRDMMQAVRASLPAVLIIDELDAVAQHRGTGIGGGNDERQQTINQLLSELDGFEDNEGLIVFGMTNRPDVLDPAIVRSGRFGDKKITVPLPDKQGRFEILGVHSRGVALEPTIDLMEVAIATSGFSGADIAALMKVHGPAAAIKRTRKVFGLGRKATSVTRADLDVGISAIQMGSAATEGKSKRLSDGVKKLLAYHELGHALVGEFLFRMNRGWDYLWGEQVRKITIIGAGGAGGYTLMQGDEDPFCMTEEQLRGQITGLLAANRAEKKFLNTTSTGASNDIDRAYSLAKHMVTRYGMSQLGPICVGKEEGSPFLGKAMATSGGYGLGPESSNQIDHEIYLILADCQLRADRILVVLEDFMHFVAPILIEEETMLRERFCQLWEERIGSTLPEISLDIAPANELLQLLPKNRTAPMAS